MITYKPKTFDNVDIRLDITEYLKTSHRLSKTIKNSEKIDSNSSL